MWVGVAQARGGCSAGGGHLGLALHLHVALEGGRLLLVALALGAAGAARGKRSTTTEHTPDLPDTLILMLIVRAC